MTKARIGTAALLLAAGATSGQVVLTIDDFYVLGEYYRGITNADGVNVDVSDVIGEAGGPYVWDFTGFEARLPRGVQYDYVPIDDGGYGQQNIFPGASHAERQVFDDAPGEPAWAYQKYIEGVGRTIYGAYTPFADGLAQAEAVFQPPIVDVPSPLQYLSTWTEDTEYYTVYQSGDLAARVVINYDAICDAYGTVILPNLGSREALRVNEESTYQVSIDFGGSWIPAGTFYIRHYYWWAEDLGLAVDLVSDQSEVSMPPDQFSVASGWVIQNENSNPIEPPVIEEIPDQTLYAVNQFYSYDADATGLPSPQWSLIAAPPGMEIVETTGVIEWIPTGLHAGVHQVDVFAENVAGNDQESFTLTVFNANEAPRALFTDIFADPTVDLDWAAMEFPQLVTGHNVYRSETPGSGYALISETESAVTEFGDDGATAGAINYYVVSADLEANGEAVETVYSNEVIAYRLASNESPYVHDDGSVESALVVGGVNAEKAIMHELAGDDEVRLTKVAVYLDELVGAGLTIKVYDDDNGFLPGSTLLQLSYPAEDLRAGWNLLDIQPDFLQPVFTGGAFFVGIVEGSTENPVGLDNDNDGHSWSKAAGGAWSFLSGRELMIRAIVEGAEVDCPGDLNGDLMVDISDLGILLASFQVDGGGDLDGDGDTDISDLGILLANFEADCR
jgi:hypothetical protein